MIDYRSEDFCGDQPYHLILVLVAHRSVFAYRQALSATVVTVASAGVRAGTAASRDDRGSPAGSLIAGWECLPSRTDRRSSSRWRTCASRGEVSIHIDRTFGLDDVPEALAYVGEGRSLGKSVVIVNSPNATSTSITPTCAIESSEAARRARRPTD